MIGKLYKTVGTKMFARTRSSRYATMVGMCETIARNISAAFGG